MSNKVIDLTPKQIERIVPILHEWIINDTIDCFQCQSKLFDLGLDDEEVEFCMDAVNLIKVDKIGVEAMLLEAIEDANYDDGGDDCNYCGYDDVAHDEWRWI